MTPEREWKVYRVRRLYSRAYVTYEHKLLGPDVWFHFVWREVWP